MKNLYLYILLACVVALTCSCNDEWKEELYTHYVSFSAPINYQGVTDIYVRYKEGDISTYQLPLIVSGTTTNSQNLNVKVDLDIDSLNTLNYERFQNREDLYFIPLSDSYYELPDNSVTIPAGSRQGLLPIKFTFKDIDLFTKWVLPLTIVDDDSYNYRAHPRKNYRKAMLRVIPFNDFSGVYQSTAIRVYFTGTTTNALVVNTRSSFVVDNNTVFFYAGTTDEDDVNRSMYKILMTFNDSGTLNLRAENEDINFKLLSKPEYIIEETMDDLQPYLMHRYITVNLSYSYDDITSVPGNSISYEVSGSMISERKINTQIPDEDQAIEW